MRVWLSRWSSGAGRAHAVVVSVLTPAEVLIAARRLAGARPHLAAVAGIAHHEDLWQLCRDELYRRPHQRLGHPRPLVRRGHRGHAAARGVATRRDDPLARDRRPDRTARTPQLTLTKGAQAPCYLARLRALRLRRVQSIIGGTTETMKKSSAATSGSMCYLALQGSRAIGFLPDVRGIVKTGYQRKIGAGRRRLVVGVPPMLRLSRPRPCIP